MTPNETIKFFFNYIKIINKKLDELKTYSIKYKFLKWVDSNV